MKLDLQSDDNTRGCVNGVLKVFTNNLGGRKQFKKRKQNLHTSRDSNRNSKYDNLQMKVMR